MMFQLFPRLRFLACTFSLVAMLCGCATSHPPSQIRPFNFDTDSFSFANELVWEYYYDENGKWTDRPRVPAQDYTHHCFVVARSARQFFEHARFDATVPAADTDTYRHLIHQVLATRAGHTIPDSERIIIPGYANLREFSADHAQLLKDECGGAWQSYVQRGHWRMVFPFSRGHQENMAEQLVTELQTGHPAVVHIVTFPSMTINHALLLMSSTQSTNQILFSAYDPNNSRAPIPLTFDRTTRTFTYPVNDYFPGGAVNIYEVYNDLIH